MIRKILILLYMVVSMFIIEHKMVYGQENTVPIGQSSEMAEAKIITILDDKEIDLMGIKQPYQKLELQITKGSEKNKKIIVENGNLPMANVVRYKLNDRVTLVKEKSIDGKDLYNINDFVRRDSLILLLVIFLVITIVVAKRKGLLSIVSMGITFLIILQFLLPQIAAGHNPVLIAILASILIIPATFYLSHGFNKKTTIAIGGTMAAMIITGILASIFIEMGKLTGLSTEEAGFLATIKRGDFNMKGLLLAGIMIGALGVLDDITVAQAAVVEQLKKASEKFSFLELYKRAMTIGQDHITSMVNTLILVYAGASLPLLLLFIDNPHPFSEIVNYEFIAEEIIKTLVGSIGLIAAVPITTIIASLAFDKKKKAKI